MDKRKFSEKEKMQFKKYVQDKSPKSNLTTNCLCAFIVGGSICILGQLITEIGKYFGLDSEQTSILTPCMLILLSCILTGFGFYSKLAKHAGAGTIVPITGFANAVSSPSIDSKSEGYVLGVGAKMFSIAGPVIVFGTTASVIWGIIYYLVR